MKQFVKALPTDGDCFKYIFLQFPGLSIEEIKAGVFDGPQIRQLIKNEQFTGTLRGMLGYHSNTSSRTFLEIHVHKLHRNCSETTGELQSTWLQHEY